MAAADKDQFKRIEGIEELKSLVGQLVQFYNPEADGYAMGKVKKVYSSKRTVEAKEEIDMAIELKDGVQRPGKPYTIEKYEEIRERRSAVHIGRVMKRGMRYMVMSEPSEQIS